MKGSREANITKIVVKMIRYDSDGQAEHVEQDIRRVVNLSVKQAVNSRSILMEEARIAADICLDRFLK